MARNEIFNQHVRVNAIGNNNIITKNTWVADINETDFVDWDNDGEIDWIPGTWTGSGRRKPTTNHIDICFDELSPNFFDIWNIGIEVENELRDAILNSPVNSKITYLGGNIFFFTDSITFSRCIEEVILPPKKLLFFRPLFAPKNGWGHLPTETFEVDAAQYTGEGVLEGAGSFVIDNRTGIYTSFPDGYEEQPLIEESNHLLVSPNPTNGVFVMELDEETKANLEGEVGTVIVADGYGYQHIQLEDVQATDQTEINLSGYKAGVYNVRFEIAGEVFYRYVVKTDE